jgi:hypothetical protein
MSDTEFKDKFIGFVDILGWKKLEEAAKAGTGLSLTQLREALEELGTPEDQKRFETHGPVICPGSSYVRRDLNFRLTQFTDCVVVSTEVSPAGVINVISHCWVAVIQLLLIKGIMCRGYITRGPIHHTDTPPNGPGCQEAYAKEKQVTAFKRCTRYLFMR